LAAKTFFGEIRAILIYLGPPRYPSAAVTFLNVVKVDDKKRAARFHAAQSELTKS
jgi:hypothetical protein